jgi:hypothetical protein
MMADDEGFLARWSRRKRGAAADVGQDTKAGRGEEADIPPGISGAPPAAKPPGSFDPESLPPIDSIGVGSDIRAFLKAGVPADVTRAALRRAWSADPAIRDFIGLSENSWDFNAPGGVPGFGALTGEDSRRLLERLMERAEAAEPARPDAKIVPADQAAPATSESSSPEAQASDGDRHDREQQDAQLPGPLPDGKVNAAMRHEEATCEYCPPPVRRGHGGALPQ